MGLINLGGNMALTMSSSFDAPSFRVVLMTEPLLGSIPTKSGASNLTRESGGVIEISIL
jgi:hypothetical protein